MTTLITSAMATPASEKNASSRCSLRNDAMAASSRCCSTATTTSS
jgi:hypothetical protein